MASCEPCRKRRANCDHGRPVCGRCAERGFHFRCVYHPASTTRSVRAKTKSKAPACPSNAAVDQEEPIVPIQNTAASGSPISTGTMTGQDDFLASANLVKTVVNTHDFSQQASEPSHEERIRSLSGALEQLFYPGRTENLARLTEKYYAHGISSITPRSLIAPSVLSCLDRGTALFKVGTPKERARPLSEMILQETAKPVVIEASMTPQIFMNIFSGDKIRLEYLGIIFAVAAWASQIEPAESDMQESSVQNMLYCSALCLRIAREVTTTNDMTLWLAHHYYILIASDKGHSSKSPALASLETVLNAG